MKAIPLLTLVLLTLLPSCGLLKKKPGSVRINPNIHLAGRVQRVDEAAKFVLIRRYGPWRVGEGDVVESRGEGRAANLLPTGERLGEHVAADIVSGTVGPGDGVYIRRVTPSAKPGDSAKPDNQPDTSQTP